MTLFLGGGHFVHARYIIKLTQAITNIGIHGFKVSRNGESESWLP